jgi:hypothetical protein
MPVNPVYSYVNKSLKGMGLVSKERFQDGGRRWHRFELKENDPTHVLAEARFLVGIYEDVAIVADWSHQEYDQFVIRTKAEWDKFLGESQAACEARAVKKVDECPPPATDACSICLEKEGEMWVKLRHCKHAFHAHCLKAWGHKSCPLCRSQFVGF